MLEPESYKEFIHFGLTSQDINNTSVPLSLKEAVQDQYLPQLEKVISKLKENFQQSGAIFPYLQELMVNRLHQQEWEKKLTYS